MTGALVVIGAGSAIQPLVAALFQLIYVLSVLKLSPYGSDDDDLTSFVSNLTIFLGTLASMVMITSDSDSASLDADFMGSFLITLSVGTILFDCAMIFLNTKLGSRLRSCRAPRGATNTPTRGAPVVAQSASSNNVKVTPRESTWAFEELDDSDSDYRNKGRDTEEEKEVSVSDGGGRSAKKRLELRKKKTQEHAREREAHADTREWT